MKSIKNVLLFGLTLVSLVGCKLPTPNSSDSQTSGEGNSSLVSSEATLEKEFDYMRTVTFESMGGTSIPSQEVEEGKTCSKPTDPSKGDYKFVGWYLDDQLYDFSSPVYFDITLEAHWEFPQC